MSEKENIIKVVYDLFGQVEYPGDNYLQGSYEGCEPYEAIEPFKGKTDWTTIESTLLDQNYTALSFFSEAGLRFFLPAYIVADLKEELYTADPLNYLIHGFSDITIEIPIKDRIFIKKTGKSALVNPRRYGGLTFYDYSRYRFTIFTREESKAIVEYLRYKRDIDPTTIDQNRIDEALNLFWLERAEKAPLSKELKEHIKEEQEYINLIKE